MPRYDDAGSAPTEDGLSDPAHEEAPVRHRRASARLLRDRRRLALVATLAASVTGCGLTHLSDLNFRVDNRLHFDAPKSRSLVHSPLTVSWTMRDFTIAGPGSAAPSRHAGYFAVFVDRAPIKPGETLKAVGKGDPTCENNPKCPDKTYLNNHRVYTTTQTHLRLPLVTDIAGNHESVQMHAVTVVLLDTSGHRIGESAWELDFRMRKVSTV